MNRVQRAKNIDLILLSLRIILGMIFLAHGSQKLFGIFCGGGISGTIGMVKSMGLFLPAVFGLILALSEFFGGLGILLGAFPRISSFLVSVIMLVAIFN